MILTVKIEFADDRQNAIADVTDVIRDVEGANIVDVYQDKYRSTSTPKASSDPKDAIRAVVQNG